jgi:hypothetical protein
VHAQPTDPMGQGFDELLLEHPLVNIADTRADTAISTKELLPRRLSIVCSFQ